MWRGRPDQIVLAKFSRPMEYWERPAYDAPEMVSLVDVDTLPRNDADLNQWPENRIDVTGRRWRAWTWLGWSLVLIWKKGNNE